MRLDHPKSPMLSENHRQLEFFPSCCPNSDMIIRVKHVGLDGSPSKSYVLYAWKLLVLSKSTIFSNCTCFTVNQTSRARLHNSLVLFALSTVLPILSVRFVCCCITTKSLVLFALSMPIASASGQTVRRFLESLGYESPKKSRTVCSNIPVITTVGVVLLRLRRHVSHCRA